MALEDFAHTKLLQAQRVLRFVRSPNFKRAMKKASKEQLEEFKRYIDNLDLEPLRRSTKKLLLDDIESLGYYDLREVAKHHRVKYWHTLPKAQLIDEIEKARDEKYNNLRDNGDSGEDDDALVESGNTTDDVGSDTETTGTDG